MPGSCGRSRPGTWLCWACDVGDGPRDAGRGRASGRQWRWRGGPRLQAAEEAGSDGGGGEGARYRCCRWKGCAVCGVWRRAPDTDAIARKAVLCAVQCCLLHATGMHAHTHAKAKAAHKKLLLRDCVLCGHMVEQHRSCGGAHSRCGRRARAPEQELRKPACTVQAAVRPVPKVCCVHPQHNAGKCACACMRAYCARKELDVGVGTHTRIGKCAHVHLA